MDQIDQIERRALLCREFKPIVFLYPCNYKKYYENRNMSILEFVISELILRSLNLSSDVIRHIIREESRLSAIVSSIIAENCIHECLYNQKTRDKSKSLF
jgi:hypothetical protein